MARATARGYRFAGARTRISTTVVVAASALLVLACPVPSAAGVDLSETPADVWVPNGTITSMARHGDRLYVGGNFTRFGPQTGPGVALDPATGAFDPTFPHFDNEVTASVEDGAGGWFVGGKFTAVGGIPRRGLAHVLADGTVDPGWAPSLPDDRQVTTLARQGDRVYVGGEFASLEGQPRTNVAAVSTTTGAVDPTWTPAPNNTVTSIRVSGGRVYLAGYFSQVSGSVRRSAAAVDPSTGQVDAWDLGVVTGGNVWDMAPQGDRIYLVGNFEEIAGVNSAGIAAVDDDTGALDTSWRPPAPSGSVWAVAVSGTRVLIGGNFSQVGSTERGSLAAFDVDTADLDPDWQPDAEGEVLELEPHGGRLYAAGDFTAVDGQPRSRLAALDPATGQLDTSWRPEADGSASTLAASGNRVFAGGSFFSVNGLERKGLAALDTASGQLVRDWNPGIPANALAIARDRLYVGHPLAQTVTALSLPGGQPLPGFHAEVDGVDVLASDGARLYLGGSFSTLNGEERRSFGAVDLDSGLTAPGWTVEPPVQETPTSIIPTLERIHVTGNLMNDARSALNGDRIFAGAGTESINSATVIGDHLYLGGRFDSVFEDGTIYPLRDLFRVNRHTGELDSDYRPDPDDTVTHLSRAGTNLVVSGIFTSIYGQPRAGLAVFDTSGGGLDPWNPAVYGASATDLTGTPAFVAGPSMAPGSRISGNLSVFAGGDDTNTPGPGGADPIGLPQPITGQGSPAGGVPAVGPAGAQAPRLTSTGLRIVGIGSRRRMIIRFRLDRPGAIQLALRRCIARRGRSCNRARALRGSRTFRRTRGAGTIELPLRWHGKRLATGRYLLRIRAGQGQWRSLALVIRQR